jgi:hypothetical protein
LDVLPEPERVRLRAALDAARASPGAEAEALRAIEGAGAELYVMTHAELHRQKAARALDEACLPGGARDELAELLERMSVYS